MTRDENRDVVMQLLVEHGFWQDLGTVRCSRFATSVVAALAAVGVPADQERNEQ